jgi:hypothetical protein
MRREQRLTVGKAEGMRSLLIPRHRWKDNIRKDLREIGWEVLDLTHLSQDRDQWPALVNTVMNFRFPQKADNFVTDPWSCYYYY